ncbi:MAG: hypothetical protein HY290_03645 [Planctomycetia bacterium]|nr:hypothetical protein [Planctomycetia bacterium]
MPQNSHYEELCEQLKLIRDRVRGVIHRHANGLYLFGRAGTSKTYTVRSTLDKLGVSYAFASGHLTPIGLFELISENRDRVIVLDDITSIFGQPIALQLLLSAIGNPHNGSHTRTIRYKTAKGDRLVHFTGGIIAIANLPLIGHHGAVLQALRDRMNVVEYEPSDAQICSLIFHLADGGMPGVSPENARMVAEFVIGEAQRLGLRPSLRLFVDKAIPDYRLFAAGLTETDWHDLVRSSVQQQVVALEHPTKDLTRAEQMQAERRIALEIASNFETLPQRAAEWHRRTGKSQSAYFRRLAESRQESVPTGNARRAG